jgi:protein ImuA
MAIKSDPDLAPDPDVMATLRARIRAIEKSSEAFRTPGDKAAPISLSPALDGALSSWSSEAAGLQQGALHEIVAAPGANGAAAGFAAALLSLISRSGDVAGQGALLWCQRRRDADEMGALYAPGLAAFGLRPEQLLVVQARRDRDVLWAMEEGVKSAALVAVLGEVETLGFTASRRLQLAAEASGVTVLLVRGGDRRISTTSAAITRWKVGSERTGPAKAGAAHETSWRLELLRCRGGAPGSWIVEWRDGRLCDKAEPSGPKVSPAPGPANHIAVAADLRQRPRQPAQASLAV